MIGASTDKYWADGQGHMHIGPPPMKGPFMAVPIGGNFSKDDLKVGMYLNNDGPNAIPLYNTADGTGDPIMTIAPGQLIGQIVDFGNGPGGYVIGFTSDAIKANQDIISKGAYYLLSWTGAYALVATANFSDIVANVNNSQVQQQAAAISTANQNGVNFTSQFVDWMHNVEKGIASALWPIALVVVLWWGATHTSYKGKRVTYKS